ncbi:hypothetical protein F383_12367 [Gossypium arboreum]|uniref:Uncharacterized protein n=1 Tax=Gossypium arboreum TaxID=29729 RepID=A0A0B0N989_GOSAR|nr:hypothetical protein F383_12367 [Gossypium arboreum]
MPKSPQKWHFSNRTILGLDRDTPVCDRLQAVVKDVK